MGGELRGRIVYVSPDKLDRLEQQYPPRWWEQFRSWRLKSATVSPTNPSVVVEPHQEPMKDIQRGMVLIRRLRARRLVGTVDDPKLFFAGRMLLRHGAFDQSNPPVMILFGGTEQTFLAMGGSLENFLGGGVTPTRDDLPRAYGEQEMFDFIARVRAPEEPGAPPVIADQFAIAALTAPMAIPHARESTFEFVAERHGNYLPGPHTLGDGTRDPRAVLIGSPIILSEL